MKKIPLSIELPEKTLARLSPKPLSDAETLKKVRKAFEVVYGKSPEEVMVEIIHNTVWEASLPVKD